MKGKILEIWEIVKSFGLNPKECDIEALVGKDNSYWIGPKENNVRISSKLFENQDIFNKYEISFYDCDFQTPISIKATFIKPIQFIGCHFLREVSIEADFNENISFKESSFESDVNFDKSKFLTEDINIFSNTTFKKRLSLSNAIFKTRASFKQSMFDDNAYFISTKFFDADFQDSHFKTRVFFSKSTFNDNITFKETIFNSDAHFDMVTFAGQADFDRCKFDKSAYFYETAFKRFPNFIQTIFDGNINFTNIGLNLNYRDMEYKIKEIYKEKLENHNKEDEEHYPHLYKVANEIRNVFKNIKNSFIEYCNMLDASNYHRVELYCKELELEYKRKEGLQNLGIRDFVDKIQLMFYRLTSDHHTDLLLILNNVIILIALFGVANFALQLSNQCDTIQFEFLICCIRLSEVLICIAFIGISVFVLLHRKLTLKESCRICLKVIKDDFSIILLYLAFILYTLLNYSASSTCLLCIVFSIPLLLFIFCMLPKYFRIKVAKKITWAFVYFMFGFMFTIRDCVLFLAYPIVIIMLFCNPSSILPVLGKLIENKNSKFYCYIDDCDIFGFCLNATSFASETLNLIYMLFLFLLLWSLQKTARKNSIVPN